MRKFCVVLLMFLFLSFASSSFAETKSSIVLKGTAYGAIVGALIGSAVWVLTDIDDNFDYVWQGAAVGAIAGTAYGLYDAESFATIENGKVKFAMPTIKTGKYGEDVKTSASLLKVNF
jgi:hypothetical protein